MTRDITVVGPLNIDLLIVGDGPVDWSTLPTWDGPADMEMTEDELFKLMTDVHGAYVLSLDAVISKDDNGGETTLGEVTHDSATPSPEESAAAIVETLDGLTSDRSGEFIAWTGKVLPW